MIEKKEHDILGNKSCACKIMELYNGNGQAEEEGGQWYKKMVRKED